MNNSAKTPVISPHFPFSRATAERERERQHNPDRGCLLITPYKRSAVRGTKTQNSTECSINPEDYSEAISPKVKPPVHKTKPREV
ncbi:MAG: hypothetical protein LBR08_11650 [Bacteroidales bacterium]|nr:hypothetical protein [Bacteroidales bacterium]